MTNMNMTQSYMKKHRLILTTITEKKAQVTLQVKVCIIIYMTMMKNKEERVTVYKSMVKEMNRKNSFHL